MASFLGPWVRLEGISISQLPAGGKGVKSSKSGSEAETGPLPTKDQPDLKSFLSSVLSEAVPFIDGVAPKSGGASTWKSRGSPKKFPISEAPVHLYEWVVPGKHLDQLKGMSQFSPDRKNETWACRRSCHRNQNEKGTASWEEFVHSFKEHHAESEKAFTPACIGARKAMSWDTKGIEIELHGEVWKDIIVNVEEMTHKIEPKPLKNRTFPVVQVSASLDGIEEFIVVSIPLIDFYRSPYSEDATDKSLVVAAYAAVERVRTLPSNGDVEWIMATASNAKGVLPQWVQNMAVPGAISKDVELFISWIAIERSKSTPSPISKSDPAEKMLPATPPSTNGMHSTTTIFEDKQTLVRRESTNKALPPAPVD